MRTYDSVGRLTEAKKNGVVTENYTYDGNGNRISDNNRSYSYAMEDNVLTAGSDTYQFNVDGFLTQKTTSAGTIAYQYSSRGELLSVTKPDGKVISYDHDALGRRITKKINGITTEKYLWRDSITLLAVYDGNNNLISRFNYADGRMPVSMTYGGATYYLAYDQVGSLRVVTDISGSVNKRIDYDSFGNIISDTNPSFAVPFGFAGGLQDKDTGLIRFGLRDYDPSIGRWTAKDPIDFAAGDVNLFNYVSSDPVNWNDPLGLIECQVGPKIPKNPWIPSDINKFNFLPEIRGKMDIKPQIDPNIDYKNLMKKPSGELNKLKDPKNWEWKITITITIPF